MLESLRGGGGEVDKFGRENGILRGGGGGFPCALLVLMKPSTKDKMAYIKYSEVSLCNWAR